MYIANRRDCIKFNGCSPFQLHLGLIGLKLSTAYLPYNQRYIASVKNDTADNLIHKDRKIKIKIVHAQNNTFANR